MRVHFSGQSFDYQTLRALTYSTYGGAESGEVLTTVEHIDEADIEAWHAEWRKTAERAERIADEAVQAGNRRTARSAYFRAHNYYRCAEFFLSAADPRRRPTYEKSRETFRHGIDRLDSTVTPIEIPYEDTLLPGYVFLPPGEPATAESRPTIVCLGGFDSVAEELYFLCGVPEALARGYAVVLFDGPGQGAPLRYEGLTARPDWEHVVGPVLDTTAGRDRLDATGVGLIGASFGGYYAPRAAAFDDRVAACVAFDHISIGDGTAEAEAFPPEQRRPIGCEPPTDTPSLGVDRIEIVVSTAEIHDAIDHRRRVKLPPQTPAGGNVLDLVACRHLDSVHFSVSVAGVDYPVFA